MKKVADSLNKMSVVYLQRQDTAGCETKTGCRYFSATRIY